MQLRWSDARRMIPVSQTGRNTKFLVTATGATVVKNPLKLIRSLRRRPDRAPSPQPRRYYHDC